LRASLPDNETERLAALHRYEVLDTPPERSFDRLTRMAARAFNAPVSLITLVDNARQYFKSHHGYQITETPREHSFCAHSILSAEITVATDTTTDSRFADNPFVVGTPYVRFYAAAPLTTLDGFRLGTLCVLDVEPRPLPDPSLLALLGDLADEVVEQLDLHLHRKVLSDQSTRLENTRRDILLAQRRALDALEAASMGYWERDAATDLITFSPALEEMLSLDHATYDGSVEQWLRHVHPDDRQMILNKISEARTHEQNYTFRYRPLTKDGSERWITTTGTYRQDEQGRFAGAHGVSWDSTSSELASQNLKMSEELFRVLSHAAPIGIFRTDLDANLTYANATLARYHGVAESELLGKGWTRYVHPEDRDSLLVAIAEARGTAREYEHRLLLKDGSERWVRVRTSVLHAPGGNVVGKVGTVDDITSQRQMLLDLTHAKESAEVANRAKDLFLANVSHELRTPLNGVLGLSDMLLETGLNPEQLEMAQIIRNSGYGLLSVVNDMLDLSRIEAGRLYVECHPFSLKSTLQQTLDLFKAEARKKGIQVSVDYSPDLPDCYLGDAGRIRQIVTNYLSNAIKFSTSGRVRIKASGNITAQSAGNPARVFDVTISVADSGMGIAPEVQKRLFQRFSQADSSSTRSNGGVGLGLAICKRLAELMDGSVGLESAPGCGSTFWVRLPLTCDITEAAEPPVSAGTDIKTAATRVLLAEDNPVNRKVAVHVLRRLGLETDVAENGLMAVDLCKQREYAIILMDCQMPEMDGYTATRSIRDWEQSEGRPCVPIVALTAHAMAGDKQRCLDAGMNDHLTKPFGLEELRDALERWALVPTAAR
jgi:PAS domain S-box-containing protein